MKKTTIKRYKPSLRESVHREKEKLWPEVEDNTSAEFLSQEPPYSILDEIEIIRKLNKSRPFDKKKKAVSLFILALFLVTLLGELWRYMGGNGALHKIIPFLGGAQTPPPLVQGENPKASSQKLATLPNFADYLPPLTDPQIQHMKKTLKYIYRNVNPDTHLAYSLPGDKRLLYWSVIYDDAMRSILHICSGDVAMARKTLDYFIDNKAIHKDGWVYKNGRKVLREGWIVNIVDAAEGRPGGRGVEHIAHAGPNIYLGIAAVHLYRATGEKRYLEFARERWSLLKDLQNEMPNDPNYGGLRMGPMGNPYNPFEQKLDFKRGNPSWYQFYNGEHAADFKALCDLLARVDSVQGDRYRKASQLISVWDQKIYDRSKHLFFIGTTEVPYFDPNIGQWIEPGVVPIHPLDTTALKISVYGVDGLEQFEANGAEIIRRAVDENFKVRVEKKGKGENVTEIAGYDFIAHSDRKKLLLYIEEGRDEDIKVIKGRGREPLLTDEWSTWVALADLRLGGDYLLRGDSKKADRYLVSFTKNALIEGFKGAFPVEDDALAYPYAQAMPYSLNKPVGFGWNTHHKPFALIGGIARIMGALRFDPFHVNGGPFSIRYDLGSYRLANGVKDKNQKGLYTEAELYLDDAWRNVVKARRLGGSEAEEYWIKAAEAAEKMIVQHPDWCQIAEDQNKLASLAPEKYPLYGRDKIKISDLEPLYRKYWALYHIGTAEFIRFMAYSELAKIAGNRGETRGRARARDKVIESVTNIIYRYPFSQGYDRRGWMWQPVNSISEYLGFNKFSSEQYLEKLINLAPGSSDDVFYALLKAVNDSL